MLVSLLPFLALCDGKQFVISGKQFNQSHRLDLDMFEASNCTYPNTISGHGGRCVCDSGFVGDNPVSERGCWKCDPSCHSQAECAYPGRCICLYGLIGDGITQCDAPPPSILRLEPVPGAVLVFYNAPFDFWPYLAFCQFSGSDTVTALLHMNRTLTCAVPPGASSPANVTISFDGVQWSDSQSTELFQAQPIPPPRTAFPLIRTLRHPVPKPKEKPAPRTSAIHIAIALAVVAVVFYSPRVRDARSDSPLGQAAPQPRKPALDLQARKREYV